MDPLLNMMGLRGCQLCELWEGHNILGNCSGGIHFAVTVVTETSSVFNVPECLGKFIFKFGGRILGDDVVGISLPSVVPSLLM